MQALFFDFLKYFFALLYGDFFIYGANLVFGMLRRSLVGFNFVLLVNYSASDILLLLHRKHPNAQFLYPNNPLISCRKSSIIVYSFSSKTNETLF